MQINDKSSNLSYILISSYLILEKAIPAVRQGRKATGLGRQDGRAAEGRSMEMEGLAFLFNAV
jgi:hypothetical protein